jgi:hypothetical protein
MLTTMTSRFPQFVLAIALIALATGCATVKTTVPPSNYSKLSPSKDYVVTTASGSTPASHVQVNDSMLVVEGPPMQAIQLKDVELVERVHRKSVIYAEAAIEYGVNNGVEQQQFPTWYAIAELGYLSGELASPRPRWGVGGTVLLGAAESAFRMAFKARVRYRVNPTLSFDVAGGPRLDPSQPDFNGYIASVGVNLGEFFTLRSELMSYEIDPWTTYENGVTPIEHPGGDVNAWYNGVAFRGAPGWIGIGLGTAAFVALTILIIATGSAS